MYDANSAATICNGGGTNTSIFSDQNTLAQLYSGGIGANAGQGDLCDIGMDVVFLFDYTGSMTPAIDGVKAGLTTLVNEISTITGGNYRLGLVTYDGDNDSSPLAYASSGFYQSLPGEQKLIKPMSSGYGYDYAYITCIEKMGSVGNSSSFAASLDAIAESTNSDTTMKIGTQGEFGAVATYEIAQNQFAGSFRSDVLKLIIVVTDDGHQSITEFFDNGFVDNTVVPALSAQDIQVFVNSSVDPETAAIKGWMVEGWYPMVNDTSPTGQMYEDLDFSTGDWVTSGMVQGIQDLCNETFVYTCDPAVAGWYAETPVVAGSTIVYYWDGTAWTDQYTCPIPTVRYTLNFHDAITGGFPENIATNHPNYGGDTQFTWNEVPGTPFTVTIPCSEDAGYENLNLTGVSFTGSTGPSANLAFTLDNVNNEVTITGQIPSDAGAGQAYIFGSANLETATFTLTINSLIEDIYPTGPTGEAYLSNVQPMSGWTGNGSESMTLSYTGPLGSSSNFWVNINPLTSDYTLSNITGSASGNQAGINNHDFSIEQDGDGDWYISGTITIPENGLNANTTISIDGNAIQPTYRFTLYSSESITGAAIQAGDATQNFDGYTGDTFNFTTDLVADTGYDTITPTGVQLASYPQSSSISNLQVDDVNDRATGTVTMPSGGGTGGILITGTAEQEEYEFVVTFSESISGASWPSVTFTGPAGSTHSENVYPTVGNELDVYLQSYSENSGALSAYIISNSTGLIQVNLSAGNGGMPIGGGSATVQLFGSTSAKEYSYTVNIGLEGSLTTGSFTTDTVTVTGTAGQVIAGGFNWQDEAGYTYSAAGVETDDSALTAGFGGTPFDTSWSLTMPSGGGVGNITILDPQETETTYTYTVNMDITAMSGYENITWQARSYEGTNPSGDWTTGSPSSIAITGAAGEQHTYQFDLNPLNGAVIDLSSITLSGDTSAISGSGFVQINDVVYGTVTIPVGGGEATVAPKGTATLPDRTFTFNASDTIPNAAISGSSSYSITAPGGTEGPWTHTFDIVSDSGYEHTVTNVMYNSETYAAYGASASATPGGDLQVTLNEMPPGGGNLSVLAQGTSSATEYTATINFTEFISNASWSSSSQTVTGTAGQVITLNSNALVAANGYYFDITPTVNTASTSSEITDTGTQGWLSQPYSRNFTGIEFTMPEGGGTFTFRANGRTAVEVPEYTITYDSNGATAGYTAPTTGALPLTIAENGSVRTNYYFEGWSTSSGGGAGYQPGDTYNTAADETLYAVWTGCWTYCQPTYSITANQTVAITLPSAACWDDVVNVKRGTTVLSLVNTSDAAAKEVRNQPVGQHTYTITYANGCTDAVAVTVPDPIYRYVMDPCDGVSPNVVAMSNTTKTIGDVYWLTGSGYNDQPYTVASSAPGATFPAYDTTIGVEETEGCPSGGGGGK
jgi:hypothetical protein